MRARHGGGGCTAGDRRGILACRVKSRGVWGRFRRHRLALIGMVLLGLLTLAALAAPRQFTPDPFRTELRALKKPPSAEHWLGTDASQGAMSSHGSSHAGRVSLVGRASSRWRSTATIGADHRRGGGLLRWHDRCRPDAPRRRVFLAFPSLRGHHHPRLVSSAPDIRNVMLAIGLARLAPHRPPRAWAIPLSLRERDFVMAGRTVGAV